MNNEELLNQYRKLVTRYEEVIDKDFYFITDLEQKIRVLEIENESLKGLYKDLEQQYQYELKENEHLKELLKGVDNNASENYR